MRRLLSALVLMALLPVLRAADDETLRMAVGQRHVLPAGKVTKLSPADPGIAGAELQDGQILLTALKPGQTDLLLWEEAGAPPRHMLLVVSEFKAERFAAEIQELTQGIEGLVVRTVGEKVVLDGKLLSAADKGRVDLIAKAYPQVLNLTTVDLGGHQEVIAEEIRKHVHSADLALHVAGGKAILTGTVSSEADKTAAVQIAQAFYPEVTNQLQVAADMLEIDVTFAQVQATALRRAGQNLPADLAGALTGSVATGQAPSYNASAKVPLLINALKADGKATVLASPHLSTTSGSEATFHSGGEQGYRVSGKDVADVKFKPYGLLLKVKPMLLPDGRIKTGLSIEVSAPVGGVDNLAFTTFTTDNETVAGAGEAIVVSGLVEGLRSKFHEKTPVLGSIPILSAFFGKDTDSDNETRLLVVVTPHRAAGAPSDRPPASQDALKTLRDARQGP